jgi:hypothetical protein
MSKVREGLPVAMGAALRAACDGRDWPSISTLFNFVRDGKIAEASAPEVIGSGRRGH